MLILPQFTFYGDVLCLTMFICYGFYSLNVNCGWLFSLLVLTALAWGVSLSAESDKGRCPLDPCHPLKSVDVNFSPLRGVFYVLIAFFSSFLLIC
jgi:hypothetical protein